jgi:DNA-binding SARP family transcriptional activator
MLEFLVLGPFEIRRDGIVVPVRGARQRALLASLLLAGGRPVGTASLVASVWGASGDPRLGHSLHEAVSKLRRTLAEHGADGVIESRSGGAYAIVGREIRLDAVEFESLAEAAFAAGEPDLRAALFRKALELWRGDALADVTLEGDARAERDRLEELRARCARGSLDARLELGDAWGVVPELERLAAAAPYDESVRAQLMVALYRSGRQADALAVYQETRALLRDELGLDPGDELRELELRILRHDPELAGRPEGPAPRVARRRARRIAAGAAVGAAAVGAVLAVAAFQSGGGGSRAVFEDALRGDVDTGFWDLATLGAGVSIAPTGDGVRLTLAAHAAPADSSGVMKAHLASYCGLVGPFDVEVDYRLRAWPASNGVSVGMYAANADVLRRSLRGEHYVGTLTHHEPPDAGPARHLPTADTAGTLRITRTGDRLEEDVRGSGGWRRLFTTRAETPSPAAVYLEAWTNGTRFRHRQVEVEFSHFRLVSGTWTAQAFSAPPGGCPPT